MFHWNDAHAKERVVPFCFPVPSFQYWTIAVLPFVKNQLVSITFERNDEEMDTERMIRIAPLIKKSASLGASFQFFEKFTLESLPGGLAEFQIPAEK